MNAYYDDILAVLEENADTSLVLPMKQYMRNKFEFYGIKAPLRKELVKELIQEKGKLPFEELKDVVALLWVNPHREAQYFAMDLMTKTKKQFTLEDISFFEELIVTKSWWDTVDWLAPHGIGTILLKHPEKTPIYTQKWIASDNIWLQRTAILFQLKYKEQIDLNLAFQLILQRADSTEFFVQKAAGWLLREASKRFPAEINTFITSNKLPNLTIREGLKWLNKT